MNVKNYIQNGSYGIVFEFLTEDLEKNSNNIIRKINPQYKKTALKLNIKDISEKVRGSSCLKELSSLITLLTKDKDVNFNVIKIVDIKEDEELKKEVYYKNLISSSEDKDLKRKNHDIYHFLFDFCEYDLSRFFEDKTIEKTEELIEKIIKDVWCGLYWCNLNKLCHRDLKPNNILISYTEEEGYKSSYLCDFGLSVYLKEKNNFKMKTPGITTMNYLAPEVSKNNYDEYDEKIDVWAFGIVILGILTNNFVNNEIYNFSRKNYKKEKSQNNLNLLIENIKKNLIENKKFSNSFITKYFNLISEILVLNPDKRITINDIYKKELLFDKTEIKIKRQLMKEHIKKKEKEEKESLLYFIDKKKNDLYNLEYADIKKLNLKKNFLETCLELCEKNKKNEDEWYKDEIIYHSLFAVDKFLFYCEGCVLNDSKKNKIKEKYKTFYSTFFNPFFIENKKDNEEFFDLKYVFIYIYFKFFKVLIKYTWEDFISCFDIKNSNNKIFNKKFIIEFEWFLLSDIFGFNLYTLTDFENQTLSIINFIKKEIETLKKT